MKVWNSVLSNCVEKSLSGGTPSKSNQSFWSGNIPWVSSGEMTRPRIFDTKFHITREAGEKHSKIVPAKTVLVVVRGMSLAKEFRVSLTQREMAFNQDLKALIPLGNVDSTFLFYSLYGRKFEIRKLASESGHGTKKLDTRVLEEIPIFLPPLSLQKKIAAVLSAYDDLIENNNRRISLLEKMAEEIYREWFVRLRFPGHEGAAFRKGIPEGWEVTKLDDIADLTSSKRVYASDYVEDGIPFYRSKEIIQKSNGSEVTEPLYISNEKFSNFSRRFGAPQENDILITSVGTLGVTYLVGASERFYFKDGNLIWFRKKSDLVNKFLHRWLSSEYGQGTLLETSIGTSQAAFTIANLKKIDILKPPENVLTQFLNTIEPIDGQKACLISSIRNLTQTRDRLLTRLISGKLSVEDLDIQFPPSMTDESLSQNGKRPLP